MNQIFTLKKNRSSASMTTCACMKPFFLSINLLRESADVSPANEWLVKNDNSYKKETILFLDISTGEGIREQEKTSLSVLQASIEESPIFTSTPLLLSTNNNDHQNMIQEGDFGTNLCLSLLERERSRGRN